MDPTPRTLRMYTQPSEHPALPWEEVRQRIAEAGTYWVVANGDPVPAARPVWGLWWEDRLVLSVGSPSVRRGAGEGDGVLVHLDSGTDVVLVEGVVGAPTSDPAVVAAYGTKYDYPYDIATYGPLLVVEPRTVKAWEAAGEAGRDGFSRTGAWTFAGPAG